MNRITYVILLCGLAFFVLNDELLAQEKAIMISASADSLQSALSENGQNAGAKKALIEEYLQNSETELALLELLDLSESKGYNDEMHHYSGEILLGVGNYKGALKELKTTYLRIPTNEKLMNIALCYFGLGNKELAKKLFDQLMKQDPVTDQNALVVHAKLYKGARGNVSNLVPSLYKELYPAKYSQYFPAPQLAVLSPENNSTVYDESTVIFSVIHSRPITSVLLNDEVLYSSPDAGNDAESFSRNFASKINVPAGPVLVTIRATDIYGFTAESKLYLLGLGFRRDIGWRSPFTDSVNTGLAFLNSFVPKEYTKSTKSGNTNIIVYCPAVKDGPEFIKSLFWFDLFASDQIGVTEQKNIKPLMLENASIENFKKLYEDWLIKSTNFQSKSALYFNSPVKATGSTIEIKSADGNYFDILGNISSSFRAASNGLVIIFDGEIDNEENFKTTISRLINDAQFPASVIAFNRSEPVLPLISMLVKPDALNPDDANLSELKINDIASISSSIITFSSPKGAPALMDNPAGKALKLLQSVREQLEVKLRTDKVPAAQADKIRTYSADWKMYSDINRFIGQELSLSDLIIKIDEYNSRKGGF